MDFMEALADRKPHAVCIPAPAQSHIKANLKLPKLLHNKGFHITFVNTEFSHKLLLKSVCPNSLNGLHGFRFVTIPNGLLDSDAGSRDASLLLDAIRNKMLVPFRDLIAFVGGVC